jgi:hypothetical protein
VIDLSATLIGFASFVLVVLAICGAAYFKADRLEDWFKTKFVKRPNRTP